MPDEKTSPIVRLQDGSIDYQYYAARGLIAKNKELKIVADTVLGASQIKLRTLPALFTVVLLVLIL